MCRKNAAFVRNFRLLALLIEIKQNIAAIESDFNLVLVAVNGQSMIRQTVAKIFIVKQYLPRSGVVDMGLHGCPANTAISVSAIRLL